MNTLTLFFYLADVVNNLEGFSIFTMVAGGAAAALGFLIPVAAERELREYTMTLCKKMLGWGLFSLIISGIIVAVVPSRDTMYMMAASEVGEDLLNTPEVEQLRAILKEKLDDIGDLPNNDNSNN